jgi:TonB family protein
MKSLVLVAALVAGPPLVTAQDDPLRTARDLYASAAYEEALAELARIDSGDRTPTMTRDSEAYRAFCLVALGRAAEAQKVAEALVRADPLLSIDQFPDASPRIAAMFTDVRRRVLPQLVRDEFRTARAHVADNAADAKSRLLHVRELLRAAEQLGVVDEMLADLQTLVDGFLDLANSSEAHDAPRQTNATGQAISAVAPPVADARPPAADSNAVATAGDAGITPPTAIYQPQPAVPPVLLDLVRRLHRPATIDVVINERGTVDDVVVKQSVTAAYDVLLVATAKTWKYKPALKDGVPVRFVRSVVVNVNDR